MLNFYEFFAGAGMVRAGLEATNWHCLFANDFDNKKGDTYAKNWGASALRVADIRTLTTQDIPGQADLAWASFPCQDLSLAGGGAGLKGDRSGTFWPFWQLMSQLIDNNRAPSIIALENVCGTLTSHGGKDFESICNTFVGAGYNYGAMIIDAAHFLPQSRPRLFIVGVHKGITIPAKLKSTQAAGHLHPRALLNAHARISDALKRDWIWWSMPTPPKRKKAFSDILEKEPKDVKWMSAEETRALIEMMADTHLLKLSDAKKQKTEVIGAVYKRTRVGENGLKVQRAEIRFDDLAGCLRTPAGGSSRQLVIAVKDEIVRARLISGRETARLMGLPETYELPSKYNETYHLTGDGVAVPVVRYLAENIFEPLLIGAKILNRSVA